MAMMGEHSLSHHRHPTLTVAELKETWNETHDVTDVTVEIHTDGFALGSAEYMVLTDAKFMPPKRKSNGPSNTDTVV
jgi:hypothetical protein